MKRLKFIVGAASILVLGVVFFALSSDDSTGLSVGAGHTGAGQAQNNAGPSSPMHRGRHADGKIQPRNKPASRQASRYAARAHGARTRLGDRISARGSEFEGPSHAPRVITPTTGEGTKEDDWDDISPEQRIERARGKISIALAKAQAANTDEDRQEWRTQAAHALGAVRADFYASGDESGYAKLEAEIDG